MTTTTNVVFSDTDELLPSSELARRVFSWLISPISIEQFYSEYSEKNPLHISRYNKKQENYYEGLFGKKDVENVLRTHDVHYTRDIDVTKYENEKRSTLNLPGQATVEQVLVDFFEKKGCSVRFLCPQRFQVSLCRMLSFLDEFWGSQAGINSYLTPANTQGFAPHYDEVDVFVLQTEGAKRWRLYPSRNKKEILDEYSSRNFQQNEIGEPFLDVVLRKGDFLYVPRGVIHQCVAAGEDSMHLSVSTGLKNSWGEFMRMMLQKAVQNVFDTNINIRTLLPRDVYSYMGVTHIDNNSDSGSGRSEKAEKRRMFSEKISMFLKEVVKELPIDATADELACKFMHSRVPPVLGEKQRALCYSSEKPALSAASRVRLVRQGVARITLGETELGSRAFLHHIMDNSPLSKEKPLSFYDFPLCYAPALDLLIESYPKYVAVSSLSFDPEDSDEEDDPEAVLEMQLELANMLFSGGLLQLKPPKDDIKESISKATSVKKKPVKKRKVQNPLPIQQPKALSLEETRRLLSGRNHAQSKPRTADSWDKKRGTQKKKKQKA